MTAADPQLLSLFQVAISPESAYLLFQADCILICDLNFQKLHLVAHTHQSVTVTLQFSIAELLRLQTLYALPLAALHLHSDLSILP